MMSSVEYKQVDVEPEYEDLSNSTKRPHESNYVVTSAPGLLVRFVGIESGLMCVDTRLDD
jgi:hypothetical protein